MSENKNPVSFAAAMSVLAYAGHIWRGFADPLHIVSIAKHLMKFESGEIKRLIITMPPRHGKSTIVSEYFPAWFLGRHPDKQVIYATYGQELASSFGRKVRNQLADPRFQQVFPGCNLAWDSKSKHQFNTLQKGVYKAVGRGGGITGRGADLFIGDDLLKDDKEAESKLVRDGAKAWFESTVMTRLEPDAGIVLVGTRWHEEDLLGWVPKQFDKDSWVHLSLPALNEDETEALWPQRFSVDTLKKIKASMSPYFWNALFQQRPSARQGNIFKRDAWVFHDEPPKDMERVIQSWDLSFKKGDDNSFVVGQIWGKKGAKFYLIHQFRKQIGFVETRKAVIEMFQLFPEAYKKLIEDKANGPAIIDSLREVVPGIEAVPVEGSKEARASAISPLQESGCVSLPNPDKNPWVLAFIEECANFPKGQHDDQVDTMSQALSELHNSSITMLDQLLQF